jgi:branched-chain amino acid transport system permease protein
MRRLRWLARHPDRPLSIRWILAWFVVAAIPLFVTPYWQLFAIQVLIAMTAAVGLNVIVGNAGQLALASAAYYAVGAYTYARVTETVGFVLGGMVIAAVVSGVAGLLLGMVATRLRGMYLAIVTIGFVVIMQEVVTNLRDITGGPVGMSVPAVPPLPGLDVLDQAGAYVLIAAVVSILILVTAALLRTTYGSALETIRASEDLAAAVGVDRWRTVSLAFAYSCALAGVAGAMYAFSVGYLSPEPFGFPTALLHLTIIVVGGLGSVLGSVVGAISIGFLSEELRNHPGVSEIAYGIVLLLVLLLARGGIVGTGRQLFARAGRLRARSRATDHTSQTATEEAAG